VKSHEAHREAAAKLLSFYIVTVSSSRYAKKESKRRFEDESGDVAEKMVEKAGHAVLGRELVSDDLGMLGAALDKALSNDGVDVVLFTGGTGVSPRDITIEAIRPRFEKELEGFGELLRSISYAKIGIPAVLTRATAGLIHGKLILCLPGSPDAVETALNLFMSDIPHVIYIARKRP
jgi:molybdenum cofactor biosynthesis protein B